MAAQPGSGLCRCAAWILVTSRTWIPDADFDTGLLGHGLTFSGEHTPRSTSLAIHVGHLEHVCLLLRGGCFGTQTNTHARENPRTNFAKKTQNNKARPKTYLATNTIVSLVDIVHHFQFFLMALF
jgi:hypothetical protein